MNWETIRVLWTHELRMLLRDRRTVVIAVILPLAIMPVMLYAMKVMNERRARTLEETLYKYAVTGARAENVRALIARGKRAVAEAGADASEEMRKFRFEEVRVADPMASLGAKEIHFYLEGLTPEQSDALPPPAKPETDERAAAKDPPEKKSVLSDPVRLPGVPVIQIHFQGDQDKSTAGRSRMRELLGEARRAARDQLLRERGFAGKPAAVFKADDTSIASAGQVAGSWIGRFLTMFLVMFLLSGGSVVAMDIIAGEKERGSLETLLTTAVRRGEIVAAKQLAILTVGLLIMLINVANILVYVTFKVIPLPKDFVLEAPPKTIVTLLVLFLPLAAVIAAVLLMISAYAKSYKEAQLYFFPVYLLSLVPPLAAVIPGVSLRSAIAVVPIANVSVAVREVMVGKFDWPMIIVVFVTMTAAAAWTVSRSARLLSNERLITSSESDAADLAGGPALFPRHVLRWYGVLGAILFAVALNVPALASFRPQLFFNELVLFTLAPLLMIWRYRLGFREALALRPFRPAVWLAVLLMIPSVYLVGVGVFRLADFVVPVPRQMLEQFSKDLLPKDMPPWQLFFFISVLPGICEEIAFRGTLLYGLHRRLRPAALVVTVGIIFGLFHVTLFRIIPTGFIGMVLTAVALLTGSVFPGMLVHAGNNALALWLGMKGESPAELAWWAHVAAAAVLAAAFWVLYKARTPYPNLRGKGTGQFG